MSGRLFCIFCSWSTTMYKPETIACHIEYYYHLTPYWPHPTMHTQASFSMYEQWCTAFHSVVWQLTAIGEECAKHAPYFCTRVVVCLTLLYIFSSGGHYLTCGILRGWPLALYHPLHKTVSRCDGIKKDRLLCIFHNNYGWCMFILM